MTPQITQALKARFNSSVGFSIPNTVLAHRKSTPCLRSNTLGIPPERCECDGCSCCAFDDIAPRISMLDSGLTEKAAMILAARENRDSVRSSVLIHVRCVISTASNSIPSFALAQ